MLTVVAKKTRFSQVHSRTRRHPSDNIRHQSAILSDTQVQVQFGSAGMRVCVCVSLGTLVFLCSNCRDEQKRREEEKKRGIKRRRERTERRRANERLKVLNRDITDGVYMPLIQPFISSQAAAVWLRRDERFTDLFHFLFPSPQFSVFLL